jgi:hypothetical protein
MDEMRGRNKIPTSFLSRYYAAWWLGRKKRGTKAIRTQAKQNAVVNRDREGIEVQTHPSVAENLDEKVRNKASRRNRKGTRLTGAS